MHRTSSYPKGRGVGILGLTALVPILSLMVIGCDVNRGPTLVFQKQRLHGPSGDQVFAAASDALTERYPIESADRQTGTIRSRPVPARLGPARGRFVSESVGARTGRRVAELRVVPEGDEVDLFCRVLIQQLETDSYVTLEHQRGPYDQPSDTPADNDAALTPEQNAVWVNRGRDRPAERALINAVQRRLGLDAPGAETDSEPSSEVSP